jgi:hypothetical protein
VNYVADISSTADQIALRDITDRVDEIEDMFAFEEIDTSNGATEQHDDNGNVIEDLVTCGTCGRIWNDALISERTPAPSGRCPYESIHEDLAELDTLTALLDEMKGYGGDHQWRGGGYPGGMIRDSYFEDYAREFADDIGAINAYAAWPGTHIDWKAAAEDLQQDYSTIEYEGVTYWYR